MGSNRPESGGGINDDEQSYSYDSNCRKHLLLRYIYFKWSAREWRGHHRCQGGQLTRAGRQSVLLQSPHRKISTLGILSEKSVLSTQGLLSVSWTLPSLGQLLAVTSSLQDINLKLRSCGRRLVAGGVGWQRLELVG
jgi:hypothetical protein